MTVDVCRLSSFSSITESVPSSMKAYRRSSASSASPLESANTVTSIELPQILNFASNLVMV